MKIFILMLCVFLASCAENPVKKNPVKENPVKRQNQATLTGSWGGDEELCKNNPIIISFSKDGNSMFHDSPKGGYLGDRRKAHLRIVYRIHSQSLGVLSTSIENEDRKDSSGNLVSWDLVIQNENAFCWHRTDWKAGSCTRSLRRCQ